MDLLPTARRLDVHEERHRTAQINAKLRELRSAAVLLCDSLYMAGELSERGWGALHLFRDDRMALLTARSRGHVRKEPADARPRKQIGFSMQQIAIERALLCERRLSGDCFTWAQFLIGEKSGHVEPDQARRCAWELCQIYDGKIDQVRWKSGRPDDCRTEGR